MHRLNHSVTQMTANPSTPMVDNNHGLGSASPQRLELTFQPRPLVRHGLAQTLLSQWKPPGATDFLRDERPMLLDAGTDETGMDPDRPVRLLAYYNRSPVNPEDDRGKGLVLLLHGWEGCSHSAYNIVVASALLNHGYDVVRLNLRDHGPGRHVDPHALNRGLFLGSLLREAATATHRIGEMAGDRPFYIAGPSMGGNFALRLALWHADHPFPNLRRVMAVSPAINPSRATKVMDSKPLYRRYFHERWTGSLQRKADLFPDIFDFSDLDMQAPVYVLTDRLVRRFGIFDDAEAYFNTYAVGGDDFERLTVPTHIITAANDGVIPVADFYAIKPHRLLDLCVYPTGGHVGFVDGFPVRHRCPEMLLALLALDEER